MSDELLDSLIAQRKDVPTHVGFKSDCHKYSVKYYEYKLFFLTKLNEVNSKCRQKKYKEYTQSEFYNEVLTPIQKNSGKTTYVTEDGVQDFMLTDDFMEACKLYEFFTEKGPVEPKDTRTTLQTATVFAKDVIKSALTKCVKNDSSSNFVYEGSLDTFVDHPEFKEFNGLKDNYKNDFNVLAELLAKHTEVLKNSISVTTAKDPVTIASNVVFNVVAAAQILQNLLETELFQTSYGILLSFKDVEFYDSNQQYTSEKNIRKMDTKDSTTELKPKDVKGLQKALNTFLTNVGKDSEKSTTGLGLKDAVKSQYEKYGTRMKLYKKRMTDEKFKIVQENNKKRKIQNKHIVESPKTITSETPKNNDLLDDTIPKDNGL